MQVNGVSQNQHFGALYYGKNLTKQIKQGELTKEVKNIKKVLTDNKFDKKENVDIILNTRRSFNKDGDEFYCIASSKKQGVPKSVQNNCEISDKPHSITRFKNWINMWEQRFS